MSTYEYTTVLLRHTPGLVGGPMISTTLNKMAADGWRLVQVLEEYHCPPLGILERSTEWAGGRKAEAAEERHEFVPDEHCDVHCAVLTCGQDRGHPVHEVFTGIATKENR